VESVKKMVIHSRLENLLGWNQVKKQHCDSWVVGEKGRTDDPLPRVKVPPMVCVDNACVPGRVV